MRAIWFDEFGGPEVLRVGDAPRPEPEPGQVRVAVRAVGVNPVDWKIRSGAFSFGPTSFPMYPGLEAAGVVDAVGPGVTEFAVGEQVFGKATRSYAEYVVTDAATLARKPEGLSWVDAVALPVAVDTATVVLAILAPQPGQTLLVNGASGAVGSMAAQLARADGVTVIGTAAAANQELVAALGAVPTTYGEGLVERVRAVSPDGVDAVFDAAGHGSLPAAIELRGGTDGIVTIADPQAQSLGVTFSSVPDLHPDAWRTVAQHLVAGDFRLPAPAREFPLEQAAQAQIVSESGSGNGKIVLTV